MAVKAIILLAIFGLVSAVPVVLVGHDGHDAYHDAPAHYEFEYSVHDPHTGDIKSQHESRQGDKVEGVYSLVEPDGHKRIVHYTADHHNGFNAHVQREGTSHHVPQAVAHHVAPLAVAHQPLAIATHHVAHVAPIAIAHHAPIALAHHAIPAHGVATSHSSIKIHHLEHH
ncbi:unnamed protein product [Hermetia illucens]|uniref:Uncharacterized protein n=1 Tax=Hermetia illucens TaxID=343691 RepID=A0A7R8UU16_HERIL|nr:cuticle protein 7-like [Hermetia illucens]CAD7087039.1 unnamed protein product [Hermetia illucens]